MNVPLSFVSEFEVEGMGEFWKKERSNGKK